MEESCKSVLSMDDSRDVFEKNASPTEMILEYIDNLPAVFDDDPTEEVYDTATRTNSKLSQLGRAGLKQFALCHVLRCDRLSHELLDQEVALGKVLDELTGAKELMRERECDVEALRVQLHSADDYVKTLLREKADALERLIDAKNELAALSVKMSNLQRNYDAGITQREEAQSKVEGTTEAEPARGKLDAKSASVVSSVFRRSLTHTSLLAAAATHSGSSRNSCGSATNGDHAHRRSCDYASAPVDQLKAMAEVNAGSVDPEAGEWRRLYLEVRRQNEALQNELSRARAASNLTAAGVACKEGPGGVCKDLPSSESPLSSALAEVVRLREELNKERDKNRKQTRLGASLLRDVSTLAHKVRMYEAAESASVAHRYGDLWLTRDQLVSELCESRKTINVLSQKLNRALLAEKKHTGSQGSQPGRLDMVEDLAAAFGEVLKTNELLCEERECLLIDKQLREESYQRELEARVAEMEKLTVVLDELRGQMKQLWSRQGFRPVGKSRGLLCNLSQEVIAPTSGAIAPEGDSPTEGGSTKVLEGSNSSPWAGCSITQNSNTTPLSEWHNAKKEPTLTMLQVSVQ
ncbi:unnamed protein product [Trypanosoma congolense IL3000]|uniref:WGS project CAEQ00000000 data, annotated contig 401 n=1 Tax=Trypanosoma congolense (strain IL3000) TaxID=1068625 RepID=F9WFL6_TRYCI|nr:unnamed protein product [Trypanosoma congolense IL3000]